MNKLCDIIETLMPIIAIYSLIGFMMLFSGLVDANSQFTKGDCTDPITRIELLFPMHKIGCWLGSSL